MSRIFDGCLLISSIFSIVVVTYRELTIRFLFIWVVNNTNVATPKSWASLRTVCNGELSQVEVEFFIHVKWEDKTTQWFIGNPLFFVWCPCNRCITTNFFTKLVMNQSQRIRNIITKLMKLSYRKVLFRCSVKQLCTLYCSTFKKFFYRIQRINNFTLEFICRNYLFRAFFCFGLLLCLIFMMWCCELRKA